MPPTPVTRLLALGATTGAALGLALFGAESALILRSGAVGIGIETEGPFAALFAAARPLLPALLARVALAYVVAGALSGGAAAAVLRMCGVKRPRWVLAMVLLELLLGWGLASWARAIERPALFDDLAWVRPALLWLVDRGEPWHPRLAAGIFALAHLWCSLRAGSRETWRRSAIGGTAALGLFALLAPASPSHHPLVILFGIDAFRPDRLAVYGGRGDVAPNLERLLAEATLFDAAYTPIAQTEPAWRSLLTARWPAATGVRYPLTAETRWAALPTFPTQAGEKGFATSFFTDCSRFNYQGESSGFRTRMQPPRGALNFALEKLRYRALGVFADNALGAFWLPEFIDNRALAGIYDPIGYAERLADAVVSAAEGGPALVAFHATAAHFPGDPVYPYYRKFIPASAPLEARLRMQFAPIAPDAPQKSSSAAPGASEALYDELLAQADAQLGIVIDRLKRAARYDEALIVVFSDHGESFHADRPGLRGATPVHGSRLSDEQNRILLAIKPPRSWTDRRVERVDALVRLIDVGPTLLELIGAVPLPQADGVSLVPLLRGETIAPLSLYAETGFTHVRPDAFEPRHVASAARSFDAYTVRPGGVIELSEAAHAGVMREKDFGVYDGRGWLIRSPQQDGTVRERCEGICDETIWAELAATAPAASWVQQGGLDASSVGANPP